MAQKIQLLDEITESKYGYHNSKCELWYLYEKYFSQFRYNFGRTLTQMLKYVSTKTGFTVYRVSTNNLDN